jgi:hypothetical protein
MENGLVIPWLEKIKERALRAGFAFGDTLRRKGLKSQSTLTCHHKLKLESPRMFSQKSW